MLIGILAGLAAGALWGLTFVAPLAVAPFQPLDLVIVRSLVFGLSALVVLGFGGFRAIRGLDPAMRRTLFLLGLMGFNGYFALMALAVPLIGPAIVALIIGALPVAMAIGGNRGQDRIAPARLVLPLGLIGGGLILVNGLTLAAAPSPEDRLAMALGLALTAAAFASWYWYGMRNAAVLRDPATRIDAWTWTMLNGVATLASLPILVAIAGLTGLTAMPGLGPGHPAFATLIFWGVLIGVASSIIATWLWSLASARLPVSLAAQLIVSETVFGLLFGFLQAGRWPSLVEAVAAAALIAGVVVAIRVYARRTGSEIDHVG